MTKIVREIEKEEKKEKVKEEKMARFDDTEEKQNQEVEANVDDEAPAAKKVVNLNVILSYFFVIDESWNSKRT